MNEKRSALILLLMASLLVPFLEVQITGQVAPFSKFAALYSALSAIGIYWWYVVDKWHRQFRAGTFQNIGIIIISAIALPIYFIRSRGWRLGSVAILKAFGCLILLGAALGVGEWAGHAISF